MKGSIRASVVAPPRPGSKPTQKPSTMPSAMKASDFHCRTRTRPSRRASLTELDVLAELLHDVLRLLHHLDEDLLRLVPREVLEVELRLLALGLELRILDRFCERIAHRSYDVGRRGRRQHIRTCDLLGRRAQRHDRFRARIGRHLLVDRQLLDSWLARARAHDR